MFLQPIQYRKQYQMPCIYLDDELYKKFSACAFADRYRSYDLLEAFMERYIKDYYPNNGYNAEVIHVGSYVVVRSRNFHLSADRSALPEAKLGDHIKVIIQHHATKPVRYHLESKNWKASVELDPDSHIMVKEIV